MVWHPSMKISEGMKRVFSGGVLLSGALTVVYLSPLWQGIVIACVVVGLWAEAVRMLFLRPRAVLSYLIVFFGCGLAAMSGVLVFLLLHFPIDEPPFESASHLGLICTMVWVSDIFSYLVGRLVGGPKLAPRISPHKTWSGCMGGFLFGSLWGIGYIWFSPDMKLWWGSITVILPVLIAAPLGDLAESAAKRFFDVKDSSQLIPGHGGLWDRLDGLLFALQGHWISLLLFGLVFYALN